MVYALLDGPNICGAYRFILQRTTGVVMDVDCSLFLRRDIGRFGIAPQTSMFWFSKIAKGSASDWRPEVHDSDDLALWTGSGEHIWRPLNNPLEVRVSAFVDINPRGFGLMQKERDFNSYLGSVGYERRLDLWVEPKGDWGDGEVQLVEIPTDDKTTITLPRCGYPGRRQRPAKSISLAITCTGLLMSHFRRHLRAVGQRG